MLAMRCYMCVFFKVSNKKNSVALPVACPEKTPVINLLFLCAAVTWYV